MAKKQSRRSISLNCDNYEAVKREADRRQLSMSAFAEDAFERMGVKIIRHKKLPIELARSNAAQRATKMAEKRTRQAVGMP